MFKMSLQSFMTFYCFAVKFFQANTTKIDSVGLLTKLFDLHQYHCGETATCGSSEHVEPSEFVIPVPCCMPCSCLPSCTEQQNCCPSSVNVTLTETTTTSGLDKMVLDNAKKKLKNGHKKDNKSLKRADGNTTELLEIEKLNIANTTELTTTVF